MKKYAFLALLVCGLMASLFVRSSVSQEEEPVSQFEAFEAVDLPEGETPATLLRQELLKLTQLRVETMTEDELKDELVRMQKQLAEYNGKEKLKQAQQILNDIVKNFPETPAAAQASQMLNVQQQVQNSDPFAGPTLDGGFVEDGFGRSPRRGR